MGCTLTVALAAAEALEVGEASEEAELLEERDGRAVMEAERLAAAVGLRVTMGVEEALTEELLEAQGVGECESGGVALPVPLPLLQRLPEAVVLPVGQALALVQPLGLRVPEVVLEGVLLGEGLGQADTAPVGLRVGQAVALRKAEPLLVPEILWVREVDGVRLLLEKVAALEGEDAEVADSEAVAAAEGEGAEVADSETLPLLEPWSVRDFVAQVERLAVAHTVAFTEIVLVGIEPMGESVKLEEREGVPEPVGKSVKLEVMEGVLERKELAEMVRLEKIEEVPVSVVRTVPEGVTVGQGGEDSVLVGQPVPEADAPAVLDPVPDIRDDTDADCERAELELCVDTKTAL